MNETCPDCHSDLRLDGTCPMCDVDAILAALRPRPASEPLPPHEPDNGRAGNPVNWCRRCELDALANGDTLVGIKVPAPEPSEREALYTIEPHGDTFVLYRGRTAQFHGYNLCTLSDFDAYGEQTRRQIADGLWLLSTPDTRSRPAEAVTVERSADASQRKRYVTGAEALDNALHALGNLSLIIRNAAEIGVAPRREMIRILDQLSVSFPEGR